MTRAYKALVSLILLISITQTVASFLPLLPIGFASLATFAALRTFTSRPKETTSLTYSEDLEEQVSSSAVYDPSSEPSAYDDTIPGSISDEITPDPTLEHAPSELTADKIDLDFNETLTNNTLNTPVSKWKGRALSVLRNFKRNGKVFLQPYPYMVIPNALPPSLYRALEQSYLTDQQLYNMTGMLKTGKPIPQNQRVDLWAVTAMREPAVPSLWKSFVEFHSSPAFFKQVMIIFEKEIRKAHSFPANPRLGMRFSKDVPNSDVLLDTQIAINTPVETRSSTRGPHVDAAKEIYAGLLYFRNPKDIRSTGGDLNVCQCLKAYPCPKLPRRMRNQFGVGDTQYRPTDVKTTNTVKYGANNFVLFVNSDRSIHSVTPRSVTPYSRRLVNIIATLK